MSTKTEMEKYPFSIRDHNELLKSWVVNTIGKHFPKAIYISKELIDNFEFNQYTSSRAFSEYLRSLGYSDDTIGTNIITDYIFDGSFDASKRELGDSKFTLVITNNDYEFYFFYEVLPLNVYYVIDLNEVELPYYIQKEIRLKYKFSEVDRNEINRQSISHDGG